MNEFRRLPEECVNCCQTILNDPLTSLEVNRKSLSVLVDIHKYTKKKREDGLPRRGLGGLQTPSMHDF